jgi:hypothetical protein
MVTDGGSQMSFATTIASFEYKPTLGILCKTQGAIVSHSEIALFSFCKPKTFGQETIEGAILQST